MLQSAATFPLFSMTLNPKAFGLACGATWAIGIVILALLSLFLEDYGNSIISLLSTVYRGFRPTIPGAIIGGIWGFVDGFIGGYIFAWLYNKFLKGSTQGQGGVY